MTAHDPLLADEIYAALDWWDAAGVDVDFHDDARAWLDAERNHAADTALQAKPSSASDPKSAPASEKSHEPPPIERVELLGPQPPADLAAFRQFWLEAPGLDPIGPRGRVPPRGPAKARLMIIVVDPEPGDTETLLSGPHGRLLSAILSAIGVSRDEVYFASALTRSTPIPDTQSLAASGMDAVLRHHIELVDPQRVIAFGTGLVPLLAQDVTNSETRLREINRTASNHPLMVCEGLDSLMGSPHLKRWFWRRWIEWSAQN